MTLTKSRIFYFFVILLVASVYYFDYYRGEENNKRKEQDSILLPFLKDQISHIELKNKSGEIKLSKSEKGWEFIKPVVDITDAGETEGWLQALITEKTSEKIGENESFEWSTYGLDKPEATLVVSSKDGQKIRLELSSKKNFEGNPFIKKNDEKVVYVGTYVWTSLFGKEAKELREKKIMRSPLADLESVLFVQPKSRLELQLKDGQWLAPIHTDWKLDQNRVREIVNIVQELRAVDYVQEVEPTKEQMVTYGFAAAPLNVDFRLKGGQSWHAEFGTDKDKAWFVWPKDLRRVAKVDAAQVEKLIKANLEDLRDREIPFMFSRDDVKKLSINNDKVLALAKEGEAWKATPPGTVESTEVNQLLDQLRQLRVAEFLDGRSTAPGIDLAKRRFLLADSEGKSILELKIGDSFKKKDGKVEKTFFYAKSSKYPDVVVLKEEDVKNLSAEKLLKSETVPKVPESTPAGEKKQQ